MNWEAIGAIGDFVGGLAVVLTLIYIAFQVRQSSKQIDQHSRALAASTFYAAGDGFNRWSALLVQDETVARIWQRGVAGEELDSAGKLRFNALANMLFTTLENNFHQLQLGSHSRNTLELSKVHWERFLTSPGGSAWWKRQGRTTFTPEFVEAVEALISVAGSLDSLD
jgi:hypothetical protein